MKTNFLFAVTFLLLLLLGAPAWATTYYVDFAGGSDTNVGTSTAAAWKHVPGDPVATGNPKAVVLQPGDKVLFKGGVTYLGYIEVKWSGTNGNPITYDGNSNGNWGQGKAIIDGEGQVLGINARQYGFYSPSRYMGPGVTPQGQSYTTIDNFEIRNLRYIYEDSRANCARAVYFDGKANDIEIKNCNLFDIQKIPLAIDSEQGNIFFASTTLTDDGQDFSSYSKTSGNLASHKVMLGWWIGSFLSDYNTAWGYIGELNGNTSITVYKDIYLNTPGWNLISGNPLDGTKYFYWVFDLNSGSRMVAGAEIIKFSGYENIYIHDNIIQNGQTGISVNSVQNMPSNNINIYNNDISNVSWGIQSAADDDNINGFKIYNNKFHDFYFYTKYTWGYHSNGIIIWTIRGGIINDLNIFNNRFYGDIRPSNITALLYIQEKGSAISKIKIYNNLFETAIGGGYQLRIGSDSANLINDVKVYNNTFAKAPGEERLAANFSGIANLTLKNNIFYLFDRYGACFAINSSAVQGFSSDYNFLNTAYPNGAAAVYYNGTAYNLTQWKALGFDQHSIINKNPLFNNYPLYAVKTNAAGTLTRIYYQLETEITYPSVFEVGDNIEYHYDKVLRRITGVGSGYIDIDIPLLENSKAGTYIVNWKKSINFIPNLTIANNSPAIDAGTDLSEEIGSFDIVGNKRGQGAGWDIGAYEYVPSAVQNISLTSGWNWISFNVLPSDLSLNGIFGGILRQIEQLKGQTQSAIRSSGNWRGDLADMNGINQSKMFKVKVSAACTLTVTGTANLSANPIPLASGWNWVAYLPTTAMSISTALDSIKNQVQEVKSRTQAATYSGGSWSGTLEQLEPGQGYAIKMSAPGTLVYPALGAYNHTPVFRKE